MLIKNKVARSFVTIMIVIAVVALLLRVAIEGIIKLNVAQNDSLALSTLKLISTALENYAKDNQETYPLSLAVLTQSKPAYLDRDYITQSPIKGYNYSCTRLEASGYSCYAIPLRCKITGNTVYNITTGSLLISEECSKKE